MTAVLFDPFESFNARNLDPGQVAHGFVPSTHFDRASKRRHTLIVGPRGSGKTTLLKMLQRPALDAWIHPDAAYYRDQIDFTGVFIPADRSWRAQLDSLLPQGIDDGLARRILETVFSTHVFRAFVDAIAYQISSDSLPGHKGPTPPSPLARNSEAQLVDLLSEVWTIEPAVPTLGALKFALGGRLSRIKALCNSLWLPSTDTSEAIRPYGPILSIDLLASVSQAIDAFEVVSPTVPPKWALLFDELELAPSWVLHMLHNAVRSVDQRLLLKLALSPIGTLPTPNVDSGTAGDDFDSIRLWFPRKEEGYSFSEALALKILRSQTSTASTLVDLLGESALDVEADGGYQGAYGPQSRWIERINALSARDSSFRDYIKHRRMDLSALENLPENERAQIRKLASVIVVRSAYLLRRREGQARPGSIRERSRKNPSLYTGATSLLAIAEGNPRVLIGIFERLALSMPDGRSLMTTIDRSIQARACSFAAARFRALLKAIPCPSFYKNQPTRGALSLVDRIGGGFHDALVRAPFSPEPPGSVIVDARTPTELLQAIGHAVNVGALILDSDTDADLVSDTVRGKRLRLNYSFAPFFGLTLTLMRAVPLSSVLAKTEVQPPDATLPLPGMGMPE